MNTDDYTQMVGRGLRKPNDGDEDLKLALKAYQTWDMYGGRALGTWPQQYCQNAWLAVVREIREQITEGAKSE